MKRWGLWLISSSIALTGLFTTAWAQTATTDNITPAPVPTMSAAFPQPPEIKAKSYLLIDVNTGQILAEKDADSLVEPASLTKLMTAYLVFEALHSKRLTLDQTLLVSPLARNMEGSRMFVEVNSWVSVEDLLKGMIVQSGNDATTVLAEGVGGTVDNFVTTMNQKAQALGMRSTTFMNPEGLNVPGHLTTARDLATLSLHLMRDFPQEYKYYSIKEYAYQPKPNVKPINQPNRNRLLFIDPSVDGLKTGHTSTAGYCLISSSSKKFPNMDDNRRLLSVLLGAESDNARTQESQKLLNWGYQAWDDIQLITANTQVVTAPVWKGVQTEVKLGSANTIIVSVPQGTANQIKTTAIYTEPLLAPLAKGADVGTLKVTLETPHGIVQLGTYPLVTLEEVEAAGF
ncbi:MAG: D-alanyl-D-alanine carboxypeptidase family protein, partial [Saezia sp.]